MLLTAVGLVVVSATAWSWWRMQDEQALAQRIAATARPGDIRMISSLTCPFCASARAWMSKHRVSFEECFIERDEACAEAYRAAGARGTPTLWVKGQVQLGFSPPRVDAALQRPPAAAR